MKKEILSLLLTTASVVSFAQAPSGLDSVIVEKYYISEDNDTTVNSIGGILPVGSVTYRIYVDMAAGYKFEAAYGVDVQPVGQVNPGDHELRISTTTMFFNNEDRGSTTPTFSKAQAAHNTNMIDSWISVGAACTGNFGVLKSEDNGVANVVNSDGVLQSTNPQAGIPLTTQDGLLTGTPESVTMVGISNDVLAFDAVVNGGTNGPLFSTYNGSWAALNGAVGPTSTNRILIAQITTDGQLCFQLNLQLGYGSGGVEHWVANNPVTGEATHQSLTYCSQPVSVRTYNDLSTSFSVHPNPANNVLMLNIDKASEGSDAKYSVYGLDGKVVLSKNLGHVQSGYQERIDISSLAPGMYFAELYMDGAKSTRKVIKN
jgi:hypothetical protein